MVGSVWKSFTDNFIFIKVKLKLQEFLTFFFNNFYNMIFYLNFKFLNLYKVKQAQLFTEILNHRCVQIECTSRYGG